MEQLPPGRASSGCLDFMLEACRTAGVQKFPITTSRLCPLPGFQPRCACCEPAGAHRALVGCSHHPAAASRERTCQPVHGRDLDRFLLVSHSFHVQISLLLHWQAARRAGCDGSAVFSSLPVRRGGGECFAGLGEGRDEGWREEWTHCEEHKLPPLWLCSSNNFINITLSAISMVLFFFLFFYFIWLWLCPWLIPLNSWPSGMISAVQVFELPCFKRRKKKKLNTKNRLGGGYLPTCLRFC